MDLFAFLGTGDYAPCRYESERGAHPWTSPSVCYVQTAVALSLGEELRSVTIFATPEARTRHSKELKEEFSKYDITADLNFVDAPAGMNKEEIFQLFEVLNETIQGSTSVVFDITHGYRSQPALGLMILNYLRAIRPELIVEDIVYGAYQFTKEPDPAFPIVSLKPLWELNEWAAAFRTFQQTGDARVLTQKSNDDHNRHMRTQSSRHASNKSIPRLQNYASNLARWQRQMDLCAIPSLFDEKKPGITSRYLHQISTEDWDELSDKVGRFMRPLREMVAETVEPMIADDWFSIEGLEKQLKIMEWMKDHGRYQAFFTVAREWLGLLLASYLNLPSTSSDDLIGTTASSYRDDYKPSKTPDPISPELIEQCKTFFGEELQIISSVMQKRNQINHCWIGHNANPHAGLEGTITEILQTYPKLLNTLRALKAPSTSESPA